MQCLTLCLKERFAGRKSERGQASLEYLLVGLALLATIAGMGALWRFASEGGLASLVEASTSHASSETGGVVDALVF